MNGFEIFLLVLVSAAVLVIAHLVRRNRELARSLWLHIAQPRSFATLPQAAETVSLEAFHRATDRAAAENRRLGARLQEVEAKAECASLLNRVGAALVTDYALQHAAAAAESQRLAGLYQEAERERERLARELQRCRQHEGFIASIH